ncbi:MAG: hypothetical protein IJU65_06990 [Desulfovibrio sp.]|nr:hypothetical protein [Desulfovibrio sp.]
MTQDKMHLRMEMYPPSEECGYWIVNFPQLAVGSQGETMGKAIDNAVAALQLWVDGCVELGTLDTVLEKCGFGDIIKESLKNDLPHGLIPPTLLEKAPCLV